jgi:hypothetical protein
MSEQKRKFHNPTQGWVGAVVLDDDNKPKGLPVEPGGSVWLSPAEERLTAEAPKAAEDNPFTKSWREVTEFNERGEPKTWTDHEGVLVLSDEPAREIMSDRFIPSQGAPDTPQAADLEPEPAEEIAEEDEREITGAPPIPTQPPVEGKPAPDEHVATPEAVAANDEHLARLASEQEDAEDEDDAKASEAEILGEGTKGEGSEPEYPEGSTPVGEDGPKGQDAIGVKKAPKAPALV